MFKKINLQLFAENPEDKPGKGSGGEPDNENDPGGTNNPDDKGGEDDEDGKQVTMTQAQLDSLLKKSFARGARRAKAGIKPTEDNADGGSDDSQNSDAEARLQKANEVMLAGTIKSVAADLGLTSKGAKAAVKLGDFSDCFNEQGEIDEEAVKDNLADFLKEYPEFAVKKDSDKGKGGFKFGADNKQDQNADDDALMSAFGVKKKG